MTPALLVAACVLAARGATYYLATEKGNWGVPENWSPHAPLAAEWKESDFGVITNGHTAVINAPLGTLGYYSTIRIDSGGVAVRPGGGSIDNDFILNGGEIHVLKNWTVAINGELDIRAPSTLRFELHGPAHFNNMLRGKSPLTLVHPGPGNANYEHNLVFRRANIFYSGDVTLRAAVYINGPHMPLGSGKITIAENGALCLNKDFHNPVTLAGGLLAGHGCGPRVLGPVTLAADSFLDSVEFGNNSNSPFRMDSAITGPHTLTLGADTCIPARQGSVQFGGDNSGWTGGLTALKNTHFVRIASPASLPRGAISAPNGMRLRLKDNSLDWILSNALSGPVKISIRHDHQNEDPSPRLLTLAGNTIAPAAADGCGALSIYSRLCLSNATLRLRLAEDANDRLEIIGAGEPPFVTLKNTALDIVCEHTPAPGKIFVILQNHGAAPVRGIFNDPRGNPLPEGARVELPNNRAAILTYAHPFNNNATSIALKITD